MRGLRRGFARVMRLARLAALVRGHVGHDTLALPDLDIAAVLNRAGQIDGRQIVRSLVVGMRAGKMAVFADRKKPVLLHGPKPTGSTTPNYLKNLFGESICLEPDRDEKSVLIATGCQGE